MRSIPEQPWRITAAAASVRSAAVDHRHARFSVTVKFLCVMIRSKEEV